MGTITESNIDIDFSSDTSTPPPGLDLNPEHLEFGRVVAPLWFRSWYREGAWDAGKVEKWNPIELHPAALVLHYAQSIFEGLKAYKAPDGSALLFRPGMNARRMMHSAARMAMPPFPEHAFVEAIRTLVDCQRKWIPDAPGSLYIRPTMIGTEACIGVRASHEYLFYIIVLPSGSYFPGLPPGKTGTVKVLVSETVGRAARGGTGDAKASANYSVTLEVIEAAKKKGCAQVMFLDSSGHRTVEEMGGMNVFFLRGDTLITPPLTGTLLAGITRDSILKLAPALGIAVKEEIIPFDDLIAHVKSGQVREAFACGTAAVITGIESFFLEGGGSVRVADGQVGPVTHRLFDALRSIQYGVSKDPFGWVVKV
ncbi:MAG: branched-chain amino acid aminotransferase [Bryobacterales bacterium]|nr:branched-chain amino acid aminotransferase [Bryobacterales bacterium]MBV9397450.1 branched-chain amino acid aminotransferase [Bryobacterales bacterium]